MYILQLQLHAFDFAIYRLGNMNNFQKLYLHKTILWLFRISMKILQIKCVLQLPLSFLIEEFYIHKKLIWEFFP